MQTTSRHFTFIPLLKWVAQPRTKLSEEHARERLAFARKYEGYTSSSYR